MEAVCKLGFLKRTGYIAGADVVLEDVGFYVDNLQQGHLDDTVVALEEGRNLTGQRFLSASAWSWGVRPTVCSQIKRAKVSSSNHEDWQRYLSAITRATQALRSGNSLTADLIPRVFMEKVQVLYNRDLRHMESVMPMCSKASKSLCVRSVRVAGSPGVAQLPMYDCVSLVSS